MEKSNIQWTGKTLVNQMKRGNVNFDCAVQRGLVWSLEKKSLLIHSMIYGYPIPAFFFTRTKEGSYDSLDGKQRSNAIYEYMNNEFALSLNLPPVYDPSIKDAMPEDISGKFFDDLPNWAKEEIKDYSLTIYYFENVTEEEIRELFKRLNNGKPLSAVEMTHSQAKSIKKFQEIADHMTIQTIVTEKGRTRFNHENIAMQCFAMIYMENPDFGSKAFRPFIETVDVTDEQFTTLDKSLTLLGKTFDYFYMKKEEGNNAKVLKKLKNRINFVSMCYLAYLCLDKEDSLTELICDFFGNEDHELREKYDNTVGAGSAKANAVQARKKIIEELVNYEKLNEEIAGEVEEGEKVETEG